MTNVIVFAILAIAVIAATVFVNEAVRRITVHYARRIRGTKSMVEPRRICHFGESGGCYSYHFRSITCFIAMH